MNYEETVHVIPRDPSKNNMYIDFIKLQGHHSNFSPE